MCKFFFAKVILQHQMSLRYGGIPVLGTVSGGISVHKSDVTLVRCFWCRARVCTSVLSL